TQESLHLHQPRCLQRALVLAAGVDEVDCHRLAFEQVIVEVDRGAVLREQRDVRKVVHPPGVGGQRRARQQASDAEEQRHHSHAGTMHASHRLSSSWLSRGAGRPPGQPASVLSHYDKLTSTKEPTVPLTNVFALTL